MNILFVDDTPESKIQEAIDYLISKQVKFSYSIYLSSNRALRFISTHLNEVDLAVIDLGLPLFDGSHNYQEIGGLEIIENILIETLDIPIIINSSTTIEFANGETEKEHFNYFHPAIIEHVPLLDGKWLYEFLNKNLSEKMELK